MADVFGLFGKYNVYLSTYWGPLVSYVAVAYKLYRNYDGLKSTFGNISCKATMSDTAAASVYASNDSHDSSKLHVIVINKNFTGQSILNIAINSQKQFSTWDAYYILSNTENIIIHEANFVQITNNTLTLTAQPQSVYHFIFQMKPSAGVAVSKIPDLLKCTNGFSGNSARIDYQVSGTASIRVVDIEGRTIRFYDGLHDGGTIEFSGHPSGVYEVILSDGSHIEHNKILIVN